MQGLSNGLNRLMMRIEIIFYNWLISEDCDRRRANIMSLVDNLPIYKFGDVFFSKGETIF